MRILISAIITGFGLKLGTDIYKYVRAKVGFFGDQSDSDPVESDGKAAGA